VDGLLRSLHVLMRSAADEKDLGLRFMSLVAQLDAPDASLMPRAAAKSQVVAMPTVAAGTKS
jgi:hypothetical protein